MTEELLGREDALTSRVGLARAWFLEHLRAHRDLAVLATTAITTGIASVTGLAPLPWLWLGLLGATIAAIGLAVNQALDSNEPTKVAQWWFRSLLLSLLLPIGALTYHWWFDPAIAQPRTYQFVASGDETHVIPLYGEAGGPEQLLETGYAGQRGLVGGQTYAFDCWVTDPHGALWLRYERFGRTWWAPKALLHTPTGSHAEQVPTC